jgi:hypothetical protein
MTRREGVSRRQILHLLGRSALFLPFLSLLRPRPAGAAGVAKRAIFFYFPDGVAGPSQEGDPSLWHAQGSETDFTLPAQLEPLTAHKGDCVFLNGLSMGPTDSGSHPGGAKKLLTAFDGGNGESIDQMLARTAGAQAPFRHVYLGAAANANNASGDKHISYPSPGQSITPEDNPRQAFEFLFGKGGSGGSSGAAGAGGAAGSAASGPDPVEVSVIDGLLDDMKELQGKLGDTEKSKLALHFESLRQAEKRIKSAGTPPVGAPPSCGSPSLDTAGFTDEQLGDPASFPAILRAQIDLMVLAMQCGLTQVGTIQASIHTSELIMSRFVGSEMYDPSFDMRSHQASHYGAAHDPQKREFTDFVKQGRWWVSQFAYLLDQLKSRPEDGGTMLDNSVVLLCTEVCDGNTHLHDNMPFVLAGGAGGAIKTGRLLSYDGLRHGGLHASIARSMGQMIGSFGDTPQGPLPGLLSG